MHDGASGWWIEFALARDGERLRIEARGSEERRAKAHWIEAELAAAVTSFEAGVHKAASRGRSLGDLHGTARTLYRAVIREGTAELLMRLSEAARGEPVLLRLSIQDSALQAVPWEALCKPGTGMTFLGSATDLLPVRGTGTTAPWRPCEERGAVKVLAIAPLGGATLQRLEPALKERIDAGEVEWLEPVVGEAASAAYLSDRIRRAAPNVLHFLGHGGASNGVPAIRLADEDGEERWLAVELFAQDLEALRGKLRLVVLEACEGAKPGGFVSAAEMLTEHGVDAVLAHLWQVKADVARTCSDRLYRELFGQDRGAGDVARSLNEARRTVLKVFDSSAEAFSPVLYLRAPHATLFDFSGRRAVKPAPRGAVHQAAQPVDPALERLLRDRRGFSVVIGDRWKWDVPALDGFRGRLRKELEAVRDEAPPGLPMSALAQRFAFRRGADTLEAEFQSAFRDGGPTPPLFAALARALGPGVHTTLLRTPTFERALAELRPAETIYAIQPDRESTAVLCREAGETHWKRLSEPLPAIDPDEAIVVLRLYRGWRPDDAFSSPLLTEDDYLLGFRELERALPPESADELLDTLATRPVLLTGLSLLTWHHRMLLYRLFGKRPLPRRSLVVVDPADGERALWEKGTNLPGKEGVAVLDASEEALCAWVDAVAAKGADERRAAMTGGRR